jgi:hypothetical protein
MGPHTGSWYGVCDIGDDECGEIDTELENLSDWAEYSLSADYATIPGHGTKVPLPKPCRATTSLPEASRAPDLLQYVDASGSRALESLLVVFL